MKILVISDSHGNLKSLEHALGFAKAANLEAVIHCGDWDTPEAVEVITKSGLSVYGVLGNADTQSSFAYVDPLVAANLKGTNVLFNPVFLKFEAGGRKIGVCHFPPSSRSAGLRRGKPLQDALDSGQYDALFHGHTHRKKDEMRGKTRVVNPGALSRTANPSFAVYDTETNTVEFVDIAV